MNDNNHALQPPKGEASTKCATTPSLGALGTFKVCVWCNTFNQASYITATLDGFCMQQTQFPYVCIIMDDASTDGEPEVIKQYLREHFEAIVPQPLKEGTTMGDETASSLGGWESETDDYHLTMTRHKENRNCYFAVYLLKYNHYSIKKGKLRYYREVTNELDYIALCEGDDYWTDEHKLQKQADALDANPQAMMVYTNFRVIDGEGNPISRPRIERFPKRSHSGDNLPTLLHYGNYIMTLTTMCRYKVWQSESMVNSPEKLDFSTTLAAALMGDFVWLPEQTACYRSLESGMIMSNPLKVRQKITEIYRYYAGLVMNGKCKPLSLALRIHLTTLILMRALQRKDRQLKNDTLKASPLSFLLLPIAFIMLKIENLKLRIDK